MNQIINQIFIKKQKNILASLFINQVSLVDLSQINLTDHFIYYLIIFVCFKGYLNFDKLIYFSYKHLVIKFNYHYIKSINNCDDFYHYFLH